MASEVLSKDEPKKRAAILKHVLLVAEVCGACVSTCGGRHTCVPRHDCRLHLMA